MMGKTMKTWLLVAMFLVLIGCIIWVGAMTMLKWDFTKLSATKYETNAYEITEIIQNLYVETDTADITFLPAEDGKAKVVCCEQVKVKHAVTVEDGTLIVKAEDTRKWYEYIGIHFSKPTVTVYLPKEAYGAITIVSHTGDTEIPEHFSFKSISITESTGNVTVMASGTDSISVGTSTGSIRVENVTTGNLELSVSTGRIDLRNVTCANANIVVSTGDIMAENLRCRNLVSSGSTGDTVLKNVIAEESFTIVRSIGDVKLEACDAAEIAIMTDTGDIIGTLLSDKVFIVKTKTGKVDVPKTGTGGNCQLTTDTGDIKIKIQ